MQQAIERRMSASATSGGGDLKDSRTGGGIEADLPLDVSLVVPMYNEQENVSTVVPGLLAHAMRLDRSFEIILINDGSTDDTPDLLDAEARKDPRVKVIHFVRNFGQTAAMSAGFAAARGRVIVPLDGDGQNEAGDIGKLLAKLDEGYGCVSGWRQDRKDDFSRVLPSQIANRFISWATGIHLHDYGCALKAYRAEFIKPAHLYGEMHRFLPVYAAMHGAKVAEVVVRHHPRVAGKSKYGLSRTFRVITDIFLVRLLQKYATRPSHLIGQLAWWTWGVGAALCAIKLLTELWAAPLATLLNTAMIGSVFAFMGLLFVACGLCAELTVRAKFEAAGQTPWEIARTVNLTRK